MKRTLFILAAILISGACASESNPAKVISQLNKHCGDCHNGNKPKGQFRLSELTIDFNDVKNSRKWERLITRLEAQEMPPPDEERPPAADLDFILHGAKTGLADAMKAARVKDGGHARVRRLNRLEYENTLHDLLGISTPLQDLLPLDDMANGFDTASSALSISPVHIQRYMEAAEKALKTAVVRGPQPEMAVRRFHYEPDVEKYFMGHGNNSPVIRPHDGDMYFFGAPHIEVPAQLTQLSELTKKLPGHYKFRISTFTKDAKGKPLAFAVKTTQSRKLLGYFDAPCEEPGVVELEHDFGPGDTIIIAPYKINQGRGERGYSEYPPKPWREPDGLALCVQWVEVEGPIFEAWPPLGQRQMFGDVPLKKFKDLPKETRALGELENLRQSDKLTPVSADPQADAKKLLASFLARAFRRPVTDSDIEPYLGIVSKRLEAKECFEGYMLAAYQAALCSPDFLFLVEEPGPLSDHALASRLAYFLWRSAPDDTLRAVADKGELKRPDVLRRETERLLTSPRANAFVTDFLDHWLRLRDIDATTPDKQLFPECFESVSDGTPDGLLRESILAETRLYFADLLQTDGSLLQLIDSDFTYLNNRMSEFYGLPPVSGVAMRRMTLPENCVRGGVLTQASVMKVTANGALTSPVLRGAWLLDNIMGRTPIPPPPNVGAIEPDTRGATTIREQLSKHQNNATCAGCHRQIDPPGFAMECFDPVGQIRTFYRTTEQGKPVKARFAQGGSKQDVKYKQGTDVDPTGKTATGKPFGGPKEYKKIILEQPDYIARNLAAKMLTYSTGQKTEPGDILALDALVQKVKPKNYGLRALVHEVVQSELFLQK
jgi:hypothetical protein